jgi:putative ABC transport system permease protein
MIYFNLKLAIRNLYKNKVYSILIIGGFAIGFSACTLIGLFIYTEKNVNKAFANHKQVYRLYDAKNNSYNMNYDLFPIFKENFSDVEDACPFDFLSGFDFTLKNDETLANTRINNILSTTNNFFDIFSVEVVQSISNSPFNGKESIVLTESIARELFGVQNPLGQQINIHNYFTGNVTAIIKDLPANSTFKVELIMNSENEDFRLSRSCNNNDCINMTNHFLLVKEGTVIPIFTHQLNSTIGTSGLKTDSIAMQNLADIYLSPLTMKDMHSKGSPKLLKIFLAIAVLIILLSSINYLNYVISMQFAKLKEIGINRINGASWQHWIKYSFTEVSIGIIISVAISILIILMMLPYSEKLFGKVLQVNQYDVLLLVPVFLLTVLVVILINSLAPIYILSRFKITEFLTGFGKRNRKQIGKQVMLTFQLITSIALIAVVLVIFKQLHYVKHSDLGFDRELLARIDLPHKFQHGATLKQEIEKFSFVKGSTLSLGCPGFINMRMGSNTGENSFTLNCIHIGDDYLETMGIKQIEGRQLHVGDAENVCLMNEEAIKKYEWENIEGKKFNKADVVGVVQNFNVKSLNSGIDPLVLLYLPDGEFNVLSVRLASGNLGQYIDQIHQAWKKLSPDEPMNFTFYDDQFRTMYAKEDRLAKSIGFFSLIAVALTCMGLLGQIFMICLNRTKEIGIRKVNGARVWEVMGMLNKDFVKWVVVAFVIATPIAWYAMDKWLQNFAYKTELSWWIFALAGLLAMGIALLTVSWQSWRAATRNPVEALRYE